MSEVRLISGVPSAVAELVRTREMLAGFTAAVAPAAFEPQRAPRVAASRSAYLTLRITGKLARESAPTSLVRWL